MRQARDFAYDVSNLCVTDQLRSNVFRWSRATDGEIDRIRNEIERAYKLSLERATAGPRSATSTYSFSILPSNIVKHFYYNAPNRWKRLALSKYKDLNTNKLYMLYGWDSGEAAASSKISLKLSGSEADFIILLANSFGTKTIEEFGGRSDIALVEPSALLTYGGLPKTDPLLEEIQNTIQVLSENPGAQTWSPQPSRRLDPNVVQDVLGIFEHFMTVRDCGHLHLRRQGEDQGLRQKPSLEDQLSRAGSLLFGPSQFETRELLVRLQSRKEDLLRRISELSQSEWVVTVTKHNMKSEIVPTDLLFLCKSCAEGFTEAYQLPIEGVQFIFKGFVSRLAELLKASCELIDIYSLGVISDQGENIVVINHSPTQPPGNITMFHPKLVITLANFFFGRTVASEAMGYAEPWASGEFIRGQGWMQNSKKMEDPKALVFQSASTYSVRSLSYDCENDEFELMEIERIPSNINEFVKKISSINLTVKATEKQFKAAHEMLVEQFKLAGLSFGMQVQTEYPFGPDRLDIAWLDRSSTKVKVAIEVELGSNPMGELWKMVEIQPELAVLAVKGNQYEPTFARIGKSSILRERDQELMLLDVSERRYSLVTRNKLQKFEGN